MEQPLPLDVLIIGGGIAGLWILDELRRRGYAVALVEHMALGAGQTIAAQGILHGGFKHAIGGRGDTFINALAHMPHAWHDMVHGLQEPALHGVEQRASQLYCWRTDSMAGWMGQTAARLALATPVAIADRATLPSPLMQVPGDVLTLTEQVINPQSLLTILAQRNASLLLHASCTHIVAQKGQVRNVHIQAHEGDHDYFVQPTTLILAAGKNNDALRGACGFVTPYLKCLPLPILTLEGALPDLNGLCLEGSKAKVIVTTQRRTPERAVWQVACEHHDHLRGDAFRKAAWQALQESLPGFRFPHPLQRDMYCVDRAEVTGKTKRGTDVVILHEGNVLTAWPTKLVLAPRLSHAILPLLPPPAVHTNVAQTFQGWPRPPVAPFPWDP